MQIKRQPLGLYKTNCYILEEEGQCVIIDPGFHGRQVIELVGDWQPLAILITHGHADHICAVDTVAEHFHIPVYMNPDDDMLLRTKRRMPSVYREYFSTPYEPLREGTLQIGPFTFTISELPGHSAGSVAIAYKDQLFVGDTLFKGTIGRWNTTNGNEEQLKASIRRLATFDPAYVVWPGHAGETTLGEEVKSNEKVKAILGEG